MGAPVRVNCIRCRHFHITWDPRFPNECNLFGFKSKVMPSQAVFEATNQQCEHFQEKAGKKSADNK